MITVQLPDKRHVLAVERNGQLVPMTFPNFRMGMNYRDAMLPSRTQARNLYVVTSRAPYMIVDIRKSNS